MSRRKKRKKIVMQQWAKINKEMTKIEEHDERQKEKDKDGKIQIKRESSYRRADHGEQDKTNRI